MKKKTVLFVFQTDWDEKQLTHSRPDWGSEYDTIMASPSDLDCPWDLDIVEYVETTIRDYGGTIDGVSSSSDYPGATVAGAIATRLGKPGSRPEVIIRCSHKYYSRLAQRESVPEATPPFHLIDPKAPDRDVADITFPCFIKPVKGAFSVMSRKLTGPDDLRSFFAKPAVNEFTADYVAIFNQLVREHTELEFAGDFFLAETFLHGTQVTVEGFVFDGEVQVLGIVDSVMYPGTGSFARFDYPSAMREEVQHDMAEVARRVITHLGLNNSLFNIEMIYEPYRDTIHIVEINPRMCGQFADLYQKVDGTNSYRVALDLAVGRKPTPKVRAGKHSCATSFPLRTFAPVRVKRSPDDERIQRVEAAHRDALIWWECTPGQELADFERIEDGSSCRFAVINVGADSRADLRRELQSIEEDLGYEFEPL